MPEYLGLRVIRPVKWNGWHYAPQQGCRCSCADPQTHTYFDTDLRQDVTVTLGGPVPECPRQPGRNCRCNQTVCGCCCGMPSESFAGDILVTAGGDELRRQEGRLQSLVNTSRFAVPDLTAHEAAISPTGEVKPEYAHLLSPPDLRQLAGAAAKRSNK